MKNLSFAILLFFMTTMTACIRQPDSLTSWISQVESHLSLEAGGKLIWESMKAHGGLEKMVQKRGAPFYLDLPYGR